MKRLKDKVVVVIGAGSSGPGWGNGKAISVLSAREGAKVFAVDINLDAAKETVGLILSEGGEAEGYRADVTKASEVEALVKKCVDTYGRIDVLFHNVGIGLAGGPVDQSEEEWHKVMDVNLTSAFLTCKYVLPVMEQQGSGVIVATGSVAGIRYTGVPYASYSASKAAIMQLIQCVAMQYADKGIRAVTVLPGLMNTPMVYQSGIANSYSQGDIDKMVEIRDKQCPTGKMGEAWDVAHAAVFLATDEAKYITATQLVVDGGISARFAQVG